MLIELLFSLPPCTRWFILSFLAFQAVTWFFRLSGDSTRFDLHLISYGEWWRVVTCVFRVNHSPMLLFQLLLMKTILSSNERYFSRGNNTQYIYCLSITALQAYLIGICLSETQISLIIEFSQLYLFTRAQPHAIFLINLLPMPSKYIAWFYSLLILFMSGDLTPLIGLFIGHIAFFLLRVCPLLVCFKGKKYFETPILIQHIFEPLLRDQPRNID